MFAMGQCYPCHQIVEYKFFAMAAYLNKFQVFICLLLGNACNLFELVKSGWYVNLFVVMYM